MEIADFKRILAAFADEPSDVDVRLGKVVAQIRDDLIDISLSYSDDETRTLQVTENDTRYPARTWLLNRVAKLPQLADRILSATAGSGDLAARSVFVAPTGDYSPDLASVIAPAADLAVSDAVETLIAKASTPLPGATSVLYVTSDAGEGKTTVINRAARLQAERYKKKRASSLIVPIPLSGRAFLTFDDAVIAALVNRFRFNYLYFDAFAQLVRIGAIVPAFDGYEEMLVEGSKGEAVSALGNLVQLLDSSGTIFVAARKAFFEYLSFRTQARLLDAIGDRSASFSRLSLRRWTAQQFHDYGEMRGVQDADQIYDIVSARLGSNHPLLTRAVLVRRLFDVAETKSGRADLAALLGRNPADYFFTFVDAIVKREAHEKWLARVTGEISEPLLSTSEHHQLLAQIAQEMWQSSSTSLRYDVLDVIVDLFAETIGKRGPSVRQIKERLKQHSLLAIDQSRGQALAFDHEDFQNFYLGEALGHLLARATQTELQAFLSVNIVPVATVEQAVQNLVRHECPFPPVYAALSKINETEPAFSICKENCGVLTLRVVELWPSRSSPVVLDNMFFAAGALASRTLTKVKFANCQFQPSSVVETKFELTEFNRCQFERLEVEERTGLKGVVFTDCRVDSLVLSAADERIFEPGLIYTKLREQGAVVEPKAKLTKSSGKQIDTRMALLEKFLRVFLRTTHVDDEIIRLKLGSQMTSRFTADVLPKLIAAGVLEEVPWRGSGVHRRYKLAQPMADVGRAIEESSGDFDAFINAVGDR